MIRVIINKDTCKGCQLCVVECDRHVLKMSEEKNMKCFLLPEAVDMHLCTGCAKCAIVCPECSIEIIKET